MRKFIASAALFTISAVHIGEGLASIGFGLGLVDPNLEKLVGKNWVGYLGDEAATELLRRMIMTAGVAEIVLGLAALVMGNTKLTFMMLFGLHLTMASSHYRDGMEAIGTLKMTQQHKDWVQIYLIGVCGLATVNLVGLLAAHGSTTKIKRSPSFIAAVAIILNVFGEAVPNFMTMVDATRFYSTISADFDKHTLTPEGTYAFQTICTRCGTTVLALVTILHTLKPTSVALLLFAVFHSGYVGSIVLVNKNLETLKTKSSFRQFIQDSGQEAAYFHGAFLGLTVLGVLGALVSPAPKSKTD